jgi:NADH-quinone oxidoreductase subunit L
VSVLHLKDVMFLIPGLPLAGAAILLAGGRRVREPVGGLLASATVSVSFVITSGSFVALVRRPVGLRESISTLFSWVPVGAFRADIQLNFDTLSAVMCLAVTGVSALIHVYSIGYMRKDPGFTRYFAYLNLFAGSMLILVLANNFLLMFLGWEGVGLCSYLLIGFWFDREAAASAAKKAFIVNRIGDVGFMIAIFLVFSTFGTVQIAGPGGVLSQAGSGLVAQGTLTAIGLLFLLACTGKSAQFPLYVWLPDAMEGPSPVSALIHAATMVTAGVYFVARNHPIYDLAPTAAHAVAIVGAGTALLAATIACTQYDMKKVLAYSTISQLGYMFLAVGLGAYTAGIFHLVTHAFFKALLFLGAGSVMHGLGNEQDMRKMGGLARYMPLTAGTFIVAWLAISGIPPFAGFWSKDAILGQTFRASGSLGRPLWVVGLVTAFLTAFYMGRQVFLIFFGRERFDAETAHPHESPLVMTLPLLVLAVLSLIGGGINLPFHRLDYLGRWLEPAVGTSNEVVDAQFWALLVAAGAAAVIGIAVAVILYRVDDAVGRARILVSLRLQALHSFLRNKWFIDDAYGFLFAGAGGAGAAWLSYVFDARVVDGGVDGVGLGVRGGARALRRIQSGYVRNYALAILVGAVLVTGFVLVKNGVG